MSQDDWETDSDYRVFSPGRYAMRQLGRSVSRKARQLLQPTQASHKDSQSPQVTNVLDEKDKQQIDPFGGVEQSAGNDEINGINGAPDGHETPVYRRGPPIPSGIHRRSISFDNLVVFPDSVQRRSTEPPPSVLQVYPADIRLPSASTWNSGTVTTKSALRRTASFEEDGTERLRDNTGRRKWLANLAHPLSTAIGSEYHVQSMGGELQAQTFRPKSAGNGHSRDDTPAALSSNHVLANISRAWSNANSSINK
ncbi:hypothetical protein FB639_005289, partial [Coemansia asiatica]